MFINYKRLLSYKRFQPPQIRLPSLSIKQSSLIIPKIDIKQIYYDTDTTKSENKINYNISTSSSFVEKNEINKLTYFYMITLLGLGILYIYNRHGNNNNNKLIKFI